MASRLQLVERVQSEAGWSSKDTEAARFYLEKIVHNELLRGAKVKNTLTDVLEPLAYYLGFLGLESIENSAYSMIEKARENSNYNGCLEIRLSAKKGKFRLEIFDNGTGISEQFSGKIFNMPIVPHKRLIDGLNESHGTYLSIAADLMKSIKGAFGYYSTKNGVTFWYELPNHQT